MTSTSQTMSGRLFVGGEWEVGTEHVDVRSPADGRSLGTAAAATTHDVERAVVSARAAFDDRRWRSRTPEERSAVLHRAADLLEARKEELVHALTSELACPVWFSEAAHVPSPIRHLRYYADLARSFVYEEEWSDGQHRSLVIQEPVGVVAAITPWNGPLSTPMIKIAPALAAGCSVVVKPPLETPFSIMAVAESFEEAGLPPGVLSILPGDRDVGQYLVDHREVDKVAFTGSTRAGMQIMTSCAQRIARVTLELGGKSAAIILDDADVGSTVRSLLPMAMLVNGQACIAQTRILVPRRLEGEVVEALATEMQSLKIGDPFDRSTSIGPMISEQQRDRVEGYIKAAQDEGARVVVGARRPRELSDGWFIEPTLLAGADNSMTAVREEIFGPVIAVVPYEGEAEAVRIANDSPYGLSGSVWSGDPSRALSIARQVRTGMVSINGSPQAFGTPFGGFKRSGIGREMGPAGFRNYVEPMSIALGAKADASD